MNKRKTVTSLILGYALSACGAGGGGGDQARLAQACAASEFADRWPPEMCTCISKEGAERLSSRGIALNIAIMEDDQAKAEELRGQMPMDELMPAGMFMANTPAKCQRELSIQ